MVIEIIESYHTLKPPRFILLIIEVSSLAIRLDLVINVFDLLQLCLGVEVLLLLCELFYPLAHPKNSLEIL